MYAGVDDNVAGASLELLIGEPETSDEPATLFGWFRKVWLEVSKINAIVLQINSMSEWLGLGREDNNPQEYGGSLVERLDYLEAEVASTKEQLTEYHNAEMTSISTIYRVSASNAYSATQIKSTVVKAVSPKQVLVQWDCSQLANCTTSNSGSGALVGWEDIQGFNIYYGSSTKIREMTLAGSVPKDDLKVFHDNYAFTVNGLEPGQLYYFWVTTVIEDLELEDSSAVRSLQLPTLASAQANSLSTSPSNGTALSLSWNSNYAGYVTYNVYCSQNAFSTVDGMTPVKTGLTAKSCSVTGLIAGKTYYVAVCTVLNDESTLVGSLGSGNYKSALTGYNVTLRYPASKTSYSNVGSTVTLTNGSNSYSGTTIANGSYYDATILVLRSGTYTVSYGLKGNSGAQNKLTFSAYISSSGTIDVSYNVGSGFASMSWDNIHAVLQAKAASSYGLTTTGQTRNGWTVVAASESNITLWRKVAIGSAQHIDDIPWSTIRNYYRTWNADNNTNIAYYSDLPSKGMLESGWFVEGSPRNRVIPDPNINNNIQYWTSSYDNGAYWALDWWDSFSRVGGCNHPLYCYPVVYLR